MGTDRQPGEPVVPAAELEGEPDEVFTQFPAAAAEPPPRRRPRRTGGSGSDAAQQRWREVKRR